MGVSALRSRPVVACVCGAGIPPRRAGNFLLLAQKKVTKEKSLTFAWRGVVARASVKRISSTTRSA